MVVHGVVVVIPAGRPAPALEAVTRWSAVGSAPHRPESPSASSSTPGARNATLAARPSRPARRRERARRRLLGLRRRPQGGRRRPLHRREPLHAGARRTSPRSKRPLVLAARRQRLDRLLGPLRRRHLWPGADDPIERLDHERAAVRVDALQPRPENAAAHARVGARAEPTPSTRRTCAGSSAGRLHRPQRAGLERQLPVRRRRRRDSLGRRDQPAAGRAGGARRRTFIGSTRASLTPSTAPRG